MVSRRAGLPPSGGHSCYKKMVKNCRRHFVCCEAYGRLSYTIRYDTIVEFNVDSKAEYLALSSTRSQKKIQKRRN